MALFEVAVRDLIAAQGFQDSDSLVPTYFVAMEQAEPDFAVTIIPESGGAGTRRISEFPAFTVRVRHSNASEATLFLRRVFELLQEFQGRIGSSPVWPVGRITADAGPVHLGRDRGDASGRWRVQQTFSAVTRFTTQP